MELFRIIFSIIQGAFLDQPRYRTDQSTFPIFHNLPKVPRAKNLRIQRQILFSLPLGRGFPKNFSFSLGPNRIISPRNRAPIISIPIPRL
jgi:hypothetical protein